MRQRFFEWIENGCDFDEGVSLLASSAKNKQLHRVMAGREARYADKLMYELCKSAGLEISDYHLFLAFAEQLKNVEPVETDQEDSKTDDPGTGDPVTKDSDQQLPADIVRIIKDHSEMVMLRAQLHEQLTSLPENNDPETVKKRKNMIDAMAVISPRIDLFYQVKEAFYTKGEMPNMAILFPEPVQPSEPVNELPEDVVELKKMKKNFQSANVKDQNQLEFQTDTKGKEPSPMPEGPKRLKLETRITERIAEIERIDYKLLEIDRPNA